MEFLSNFRMSSSPK